MMIRHILLWQYTDEMMNADKQARIERLRAMYAEMVREIPGLMEARLETSCMPLAQYQLALVALFRDVDALQEYQVHPLHQKLKELTKNWVSGGAVFDCETDTAEQKDN